jgi:hypothetical protein
MSIKRRKALGLPPEPINANYYRTVSVPVCGIAALVAFGVVVGIALGIAIALIANL